MSFITVMSSKGGSGKSTVVMGLSLWASKLKPDEKVLVLDGDLVVNTIQFKMCRNPKTTLADILRESEPVERALHRCDIKNPKTGKPLYPNIGILPAAKRRGKRKKRGSFLPPMHGSRYSSIMQIARQFDYIKGKLQKTFSFAFIDTPAARGMEHMFLAGIGDGVIYVADPSDESIEATMGTAKDLEKMLDIQTIGIVLNRITPYHKEKKWIEEASKIAPVLGVVPKDDLVDKAFSQNIPVVAANKNSPASQALKGITNKLLDSKIKPADEVAPRLEHLFWKAAKTIKRRKEASES